MVTPRDLARVTMTEEKKASAKNDIFAFYIGRPISYVLTLPFLAAKMKPNTISLLSFIPSIVGLGFAVFGQTKLTQVLSVLFFILWNFMDGVDGNVARYTKQTSTLGTLWDAASGYFAMMLMYFSMGIMVVHSPQSPFDIAFIEDYIYVVLGGLTALFTLFSRLVMHKKMLLFSYESARSLQDKSTYSGIRLVGLNLTSPSGFVQILMLAAVLLNLTRYFVIAYFLIQLAATVYSMKNLLKG